MGHLEVDKLQEMNQKLYNSMKAFQIAAEESGSLVFTYDTKKQAIFVDERTAQMFGVAQEQTGVPYEMAERGIVSEDTVSEYIRIHEAMIGGACEAGGIVKLIQADGSESVQSLKLRAILGEDGTSTGTAVGVYRDITSIQDREKRFERLEKVVHNMTDDFLAIIEVDLERDTYTTLARNYDGAFPIPQEGCYTQALDELIHHVVAPEYQESFLQLTTPEALRKSLSIERRIEIEYMSSVKKNAWRRTAYQVLEYKDGVPSVVILYQSDIDRQKTERLTQQKALKEAYEYAEAANTAKTDFLSRMSHDIRTPMNAIIGMTAIAGANVADQGRVKECLGKITLASRHLLGLINEVLDMSKIESGTMELQKGKFNLADLLDDTIAIVLPQVREHNHNLDVNVGELQHEWVTGDSLRIQQVFVNLITNAVKYTPDGGSIRIRVKEKGRRRGHYGEYEFCFEDNGIGMSEDFQKIVFDPFTRAEDNRINKISGTGLGMAITRNLIRMMDGNIQVDSTLDKGSLFTVTLYLEIEDDQTVLPKELEELAVLVVDDDRDTCESTTMLLRDIGMEGEWCLSGLEALEMIGKRRQQGEDYFAVLLDWKMPGMDGIETAKHIRRLAGLDIPIIFLTAYDWSEIEEKAKAAGVNRFLAKPLFKSRLIGSFKDIVAPIEEDIKEDTFSRRAVFPEKRILLAEDNDLNAEIAREILGMTKAQVDWVKDGREAVEAVADSKEGFYDLIIMDIQMPVMNGYDAAKRIRELDRKDAAVIPIVAMTANAFSEDIQQALDAGMNAHIAKPVDLSELEVILEKYLG